MIQLLGNCSNQSLYEYSQKDVNKIFNNLSKSVPEKLTFIDPRKDEFNGLEIDTPYYPAHIRKALELAGYGKPYTLIIKLHGIRFFC